MKFLRILVLSVCIICLIVITNDFWNSKYPAYSATCLESQPDDSEFFGHANVANDDYLAIRDPGANKVVIYSRDRNNSWNRLQEIYPPSNTVAKKLGYGFGYELATNNNTLAIKAFAFGWNDESDGSQDLAEVYAVSLAQKDRGFMPIKIKYPNPDKTSVSAISSFNKNIAFTTRTILDERQKINRVYIADPISGEIIKSIESPEIQYTNRKLDKFDEFYTKLDTYKNSLILGNLDGSWQDSIIRIHPDSRLEKIVFDPEKVDRDQENSYLSKYGFLTFATSDELTAIGRDYSFDSNTLVFKPTSSSPTDEAHLKS